MGGPFFLQATEPQKLPKKDIRVILHALTAGHLVTKCVTQLLLSEFHFFVSAKNAKTLPGQGSSYYIEIANLPLVGPMVGDIITRPLAKKIFHDMLSEPVPTATDDDRQRGASAKGQVIRRLVRLRG
jgi:hypothetical protein